VAQHFLLSAKARSLSLKAIFCMSDNDAHARFAAIRWADNGGEAFCPRCRCTAIYTYAARRIWKCQACQHGNQRGRVTRLWGDQRPNGTRLGA